MKNLSKLFLGCLIIFTVASCKKIEEVEKQTSGNMSAKVDGKDWNATLGVQASKSGAALAVGGTGGGGQININIFNYKGVGIYILGGQVSNQNNAIWTVVSTQPVAYSSSSGLGTGEINIIKDEGGFVEGTFSFTAKNLSTGDGVKLTEGKFRAEFK